MPFQAVINQGSYIALDAPGRENNTWLQQWDYHGTSNQLWQFEDAGDGSFRIRGMQSNRVLDVPVQDIDKNGTWVQLWDDNGADHQHWERVDVGGGWFWLRNKKSKKALDVVGPDIGKIGAHVQQWDFNGGANQLWTIGGNTQQNQLGLVDPPPTNKTPTHRDPPKHEPLRTPTPEPEIDRAHPPVPLPGTKP
jgi:hypothetical protein